MENKPISGAEFAKSPLGKFFLGVLPVVGGVLTILVSLNIIPYVDLHPNQIAIFNDPHTWEVFAVGVMFICFGVANLLPSRMKWLGRLNNFLLLISFLAVVTGVILNKIR